MTETPTASKEQAMATSATEQKTWLHVHWDHSSPGMVTGSGSYTTDPDEVLRLVAEQLAGGASEVRISRTEACFVPAEYR